ncbi:MAG: 3-methyl-2-oxobutanoate hydroxymethyltransferase [Acidobacteria bacterium]|nr:3-methyl-2-oxobutanoate hydroxymethyltransferase [Acidobacteriota bacterium]
MSTKRFTLQELQAKKDAGRPITVVTAYDLSSARLVDRAGIDVILVGDSLGMVMLGLESTVPVTMDEMVHHAKAAARGADHALLVGDMPFLSYQASRTEAVRNAGRFLKEGGMGAVKLEGGRTMADTVRAIADAGIPVMGHIGLTPQSISRLGGYRVQGKTAPAALGLLEDARALEAAGCFSIVLESVPAAVASAISRRLSVPTIGIGAGAGCDGQVLVYHDMLGLFDDFQPRFVKRYANLGETIHGALTAYREDVEARRFPAEEHTYAMPDDELASFLETLGD